MFIITSIIIFTCGTFRFNICDILPCSVELYAYIYSYSSFMVNICREHPSDTNMVKITLVTVSPWQQCHHDNNVTMVWWPLKCMFKDQESPHMQYFHDNTTCSPIYVLRSHTKRTPWMYIDISQTLIKISLVSLHTYV